MRLRQTVVEKMAGLTGLLGTSSINNMPIRQSITLMVLFRTMHLLLKKKKKKNLLTT